jgi:hypothetical protein
MIKKQSPINKFLAICLHCADMRDFHSNLRNTPFLDSLRKKAVFIPMGRGQSHHHGDSLIAELTGVWTARLSNSSLDRKGYHAPDKHWLPRTLLEYLEESGYDIFSLIGVDAPNELGTFSVGGGMTLGWLKDEPERLAQFNLPRKMNLTECLDEIKGSNRFYAHIFLRDTHRPWTQPIDLCGMLGWKSKFKTRLRRIRGLSLNWPYNAYNSRRAALEKPDEFAALRRRALSQVDGRIAQIFEATRDIKDLTYIIYSNHGEVYDHFRYNQPYRYSITEGLKMIEGTSHGNFPYEVVYANTQFWIIPDYEARVMRGIGRSIDMTPTILELAGVKAEGMDGTSMLNSFTEGVFPERDRYAETIFGGGALSMVRKDGYKLLSVGPVFGVDGVEAPGTFPDHGLAVFDLKSDPYEYVNLIHTEYGDEVLDWAIQTHAELKKQPKAKIS